VWYNRAAFSSKISSAGRLCGHTRDCLHVSIKLEFVYAKCPSCLVFVSLDIALLPDRILEMRKLLEKIPVRCPMCHSNVPGDGWVLKGRKSISGIVLERENR
jgi:hypothetical protein